MMMMTQNKIVSSAMDHLNAHLEIQKLIALYGLWISDISQIENSKLG